MKAIESTQAHVKAPKKKALLPHSKEVKPDQVIPFDDDDDFEDF